MKVLQSSNNPQAMLQLMVQTNPKLRDIMQYINQHGGNPETAFYAMAKEKGVNPDEVIKMLQQ